MSKRKTVIVTIELPNTQDWNDWETRSTEQVLKELENDIKDALIRTYTVDEVGYVDAKIDEFN